MSSSAEVRRQAGNGRASRTAAATVDVENPMLTGLFGDNLRRWLDGQSLRNLYSPEMGY